MKRNLLLTFAAAVPLMLSCIGQYQAAAAENNAAEAAVASIIPPAGEHPRLYLRADQIPELRKRMATAEGKAILSKIEKNSIERTAEEEAAETDRGFRYYAKMRGLPSRAQLQALDYLVNGNAESARTAITTVLDSLRRTHFGTKQDLSRASGIMIMTGAIVYDWCYDRMTDTERQDYIKEFIRIAGTMECGYPPKRNEPIAGHCSEWMLLRDLLSGAIAIYDEHPDMYNMLLEQFDSDYKDVRNYIYAGGNYHQGTSYINVRFSNDMFCQWILKRMSGQDYFDRTQQNVLYDLIYRRRPDGQVLPAGDCNHTRGKANTYTLPMMLAGSYYTDPYLLHEARMNRTNIDQHCLLFQLLWEDWDTADKSPKDLPLSRYSGTPFGWMTARTGWGDDSVIAEMKVNEQFVGNHQHLDGGSFQIYYRGPLALDTGYYQGASDGGYNSPNNKNYTKRTIAHNSLLVYDPSEIFECYNYGGAGRTQTAGNDGGQRMVGIGWDTCRSFEQLLSEEYTVGKTLAHGFGPDPIKPDYSLLKGDITPAYSRNKVSDVRRSFVFLNLHDKTVPAALIVFDRIVSKDPSFKKTWLLHSIEEPRIDGNSFSVCRTKDGDIGMLHCNVLWPENAALEKIGGKGKEMYVGGVNYLNPLRHKDTALEHGVWRVEESPAQAAEEDIFLNVMQVCDNSCTSLRAVRAIDSPKAVGAVIADRAVTFSRNGEQISEAFSFSVPKGSAKKLQLLVTDLADGSWTVRHNGKVLASGLVPDADSHSIYISGKAGEYTITRE